MSRLFLLSIVCTCLCAADSLPSVAAATTIEEEALPVPPVPAISLMILDAQVKSLLRSRMLAGCKVAPLSEIEDDEALAFERNAETAPADVDGLMPQAALAL